MTGTDIGPGDGPDAGPTKQRQAGRPPTMPDPALLEKFPGLVCPACRADGLEIAEVRLVCASCGQNYEILDGVIPMLVPPGADVSQAEVTVQDKVAAAYEGVRYDNPWSAAYHRWWTDLMVAEVATGGRILDNGCGIGLFFDRLSGADVTGLDISGEMLRVAKSKSRKVLLADSQNIPFADESFDTVFARSLIHHLPDPRRGVAEIARVLRRGGEVVSIDTNKTLLSAIPRAIANRGEHFSEEHKNLHRRELIDAFAEHFEVQKVRFFGYVAYPLLGFPDLIDLFRFVPMKRLSYNFLLALDETLARIPVVRTQAWGLLLKCKKP